MTSRFFLSIPRVVLGALIGLSLGGAPALQAREGVDVGGNSAFSRLVPAEQVERAAAQQYAQMLSQAHAKNALADASLSLIHI
mgnify:FL=1